MSKLTVEQFRNASEVMRKLVRKAGFLLVWTDAELEELADELQYTNLKDSNLDSK